jgi:hypothetical protein
MNGKHRLRETEDMILGISAPNLKKITGGWRN